jgi:hypothetical protein
LSYKLSRNSEGWVESHDHPEIENDHGVIRRVSDYYVVDDPKVAGGKRISTGLMNASTTGSKGMSVDLQNRIESVGLDPYVFVTTPKWIGSVRFVAGGARELGFQVGLDPLDENYHHGEVWGGFTRGKQKALLRKCEWFVQLKDVVLHVD